MATYPGSWMFSEATDWVVDDRTHAMHVNSTPLALYRTLDVDNEEVRLLHIEPNTRRNAPLRCTLTQKSLKDRPEFQALSYAWGEKAQNTSLHVGDGSLSITSDLHNALCAVRSTEHTLSLWVDAICINQHDLDERNHQVKLMKQIYTQASSVNVWLGEELHRSSNAFGSLNKLAQGASLVSLLTEVSPFDRKRRVQELKQVFEFGWWQRLWIIQEALLNKHTVLHCGRSRIQFSTIMQAFEAIWNEYISAGQRLRDLCGAGIIEPLIRLLEITVRRLHTIHSLVFLIDAAGKRQFRDSAHNLPFLLHVCGWSQASDPRDMIYGTLGLFTKPFLQPDYNLSVEQAYTRGAFDIIKFTGNLSLLSQAYGTTHGQLVLPSWVPDWTQPTVLPAPFLAFYDLYEAAKRSKLWVSLIDDRKLEVAAKFLHEVAEVGDEYDHGGCSVSSQLPKILSPAMRSWKGLELNSRPPGAMIKPTEGMGERGLRVVDKEVHDHLARKRLERSSSNVSSGDATVVQPSEKGEMHQDAVDRPQDGYASLHNDSDYSSDHPRTAKRFKRTVPPAATNSMQAAFSNSVNRQMPSKPTGVAWGIAAYQPQQSQRAPFYEDADYNKSATPNAGALSRSNTLSSGYRVYDSFSHSYVLPNQQSNPNHISTQGWLDSTPDSAFWRTICMDVIDCSITQKLRRCSPPDHSRVQEWLDWILGPPPTTGLQEVKPSSKIPQVHWHLNTTLQGKRMVRTNGGKLGLAGRDVRIGDKVAVFGGEAFPYILRPVTSDIGAEREEFKIVCPAYVHGLMDGEGMTYTAHREWDMIPILIV